MKQKNIFETLRADHREVQSLLTRIEKTSERAQKSREKWYARVREAITTHSKAEERAIYPQLESRVETEAIGFECEEEHDLVKQLLSKLDSLRVGDERWTSTLTVLKETLEHHIQKEETVGFKLLRRYFSASELKELVGEFESAKKGFLAPLKKLLAA